MSFSCREPRGLYGERPEFRTLGARARADAHRAGRLTMPIFLRQQARVGSYLVQNRLRGRTRYPLIVELEPLFACNLACAGCGKTAYPADVLRQRMPVETALAAIGNAGRRWCRSRAATAASWRDRPADQPSFCGASGSSTFAPTAC